MATAEKKLIAGINDSLALKLRDGISMEELKDGLASYFRKLIQEDFHKLVGLLYRIDVDEEKLKHLLDEDTEEDAGSLIAGLVIERQLGKIKTREIFRATRDDSIDENEKW